jgi:hypothetical protein
MCGDIAGSAKSFNTPEDSRFVGRRFASIGVIVVTTSASPLLFWNTEHCPAQKRKPAKPFPVGGDAEKRNG